MDDRGLEACAREIRDARKRAIESAVLAGVTVVGAAVGWLVSVKLSLALGIGGTAESALALHFLLSCRGRIERLALDPDAYTIPEVRRFGMHAATYAERRRLAQLTALALAGRIYAAPYLPERLRRFERELADLAADLRSPNTELHPAAAVAWQRLLTNGVQSPLFNPELPPEDVAAAIARVRSMTRE